MNSTNPNRGHYHPAPVITRPPAPAGATSGQSSKPAGGKGGGSR